MFRQRPAELFFTEAKRRDVGIIVRVPLASGLLTGKFSAGTTFSKEDHRNFNRDGAGFDKGETFSGVDYETGLAAVDELKAIFPDNENLALDALRWILTFDAVSCIIPGASKPEHLTVNVQAAERPAPTPKQMAAVSAIYEKRIENPVHYLW